MFQVPSFCEQKPDQTILQNLNQIKSTCSYKIWISNDVILTSLVNSLQNDFLATCTMAMMFQ